MRVMLAEDAVTDPDCWRYLDQIVNRIDEGAHEWVVDDPELIEASAWLQKARSHIPDLFQKVARREWFVADGLHARCLLVTKTPCEDRFSLAPAEAARFLAKPVSVLVENRFSDGTLLKVCLEHMAPKGFAELAGVHKLWECDSVGGNTELLKLIEDSVQEAAREKLPPRIVVFTDGDGKVPGELSAAAQKIEAVCRDHCLPCLVLRKRAIENYIPDESLQAWGDAPEGRERRETVMALLRMAQGQRDHFPIKSGLDLGETAGKLTDTERELYKSIPDTDRPALRQGLGPKVYASLSIFPDQVSAATLRRRDQDGDLDALVSMVVTEL